MAGRLELQSKLEELLGTRNVYYQPPESIKIGYPAIVYFKNNIVNRYANDGRYLKKNRYEIIVISKKPDESVIDKIMDLPYCSYDRSYKSDNLYHDVLILNY